MFKIVGALAIALILGVIAYLSLWPISIRPESWRPSPVNDALIGFQTDARLDRSESVFEDFRGPEALVTGPDGLIYSGLADGRVIRFDPARLDSPAEIIGRTNGRPYGLRVRDDGAIFIADGRLGVVKMWASDGRSEVLLNTLEGEPIRFADDLVITPDGRIWFTVASTRFGIDDLADEFAELGANGQLAWFDPTDDSAAVALNDLRFANGLALHPDRQSLLITETSGFRITRYWFAGEQKGSSSVFVDGLPGWPDNIAWDDARSVFWVAFPNVRAPVIDDWAAMGWLRAVDRRLQMLPGWPKRVEPQAQGFVLAFDRDGRLADALGHTAGGAAYTTSATPVGPYLYLGSGRRMGVRRVAIGQPQ